MRRIEDEEHIAEGLAALAALDKRLCPVIEATGPVPLRRGTPGFGALAGIIVSQQVSKASADAIYGRLTSLLDPLTPEAVSAARDDVFRQAGLSRPKQATMCAIAHACMHDGLDLHMLCQLDRDDAVAELSRIKGVGPWTAEVYLLFAAGHPDVFPARDIALQNAVGEAFGMEARPGEKALAAIAESWAPWRSVAARLFWAYYAVMRGRDATPSDNR